MSATNEIDDVKAKRYVGEIEKCFDELLTERGTYMSRCKVIRDRIKDWKDRADEDGIPRGAINPLLKEREYTRKIRVLYDDLEQDTVDIVDQLRRAIGGFVELPLGAAAVARAEAGTGLAPANDKGAPGKKGRKGKSAKVSGDAVVIDPAAAGDALNSLISDDIPDEIPEACPHPEAFGERDRGAAGDNAANLGRGIKPLVN